MPATHGRKCWTNSNFRSLKCTPQARRPHDFRLIIMSATLDASKFLAYLPGAAGGLIRGRAHPVALHYTARPEDNYLDAALNATLQV